MKLSDLLPTSEELAGVQGIERKLVRRQQKGMAGAILALAGAVLQVVMLASRPWADLAKSLRVPEWLGLAVVAVGAGVYLTLRYTGFLLKESKQPFHYTFWIEPFKPVEGTPDARFTLANQDVLRLLHYDLTERLNRRIGRLSLLADPGPEPDNPDLMAHIHVEGDYVAREDEENEGQWILNVMPRVRIGPPSKPWTLAFRVKYALETDTEGIETTEKIREEQLSTGPQVKHRSTLRAEQYCQLAERVYSSLATEVYRQIKADVANKIALFPTKYLRAVACYYEAEDFEKSNTVDSYDRALDLYRASQDAFDGSRTHRRALLFHKWLKQPRRFPVWLRRRRSVWDCLRPSLEAEARTRLGYSRCLIYRRVVSALSGRTQNPLFEIRRELDVARTFVEDCYNSIMSRGDLKFSSAGDHGEAHGTGNAMTKEKSNENASRSLLGKVSFPADSVGRGKHELYQRLREELCEVYAVSALGYSYLFDSQQAQRFLAVAEALEPREDRNLALILLANAEIEPELLQKLALLRQATEMAPNFEIARHRLAVYSDLRARDLDEIDSVRVQNLNREYGRTLEINPGNIACLIGQGYLLWLVEKLDSASKKFKVGDELQAIVNQMFVGDLKYGQARVAAEKAARTLQELQSGQLPEEVRRQKIEDATVRLFEAYRLYDQATAADPAVATGYSASSEVVNTYYQFITEGILKRYERFAKGMEDARQVAAELNRSGESKSLSRQVLDHILSYAWNDYGNACFNYFFRHELLDGGAHLESAIEALTHAASLSDRNIVVQYNLYLAYAWRGRTEDETKQMECLDKVVKGFANWAEAIRTRSTLRVRQLQRQISEIKTRLAESKSRLLETQTKLEEAAAQPQQDAQQQKVKRLREEASYAVGQIAAMEVEANNLKNQVRNEARESLEKILESSRLLPLIEQLKIDDEHSEAMSILTDPRIDWLRLTDEDASALRAWAEVLSNLDDDPRAIEASRLLCQHIREKYYPEDFSAIQVLLRDLENEPKEPNLLREEALLVFRSTVEQWRKSDPKSRNPLYWLRQYAFDAFNNRGNQFFEQEKYDQAAEMYEQAIHSYAEYPVFYSNLALALENKEKRLQKEQLEKQKSDDNSDVRSALRRRAIAALEKACELDPVNKEYRTRLVSLQSDEWAAAHALDDAVKSVGKESPPWNVTATPLVIEVGRALLGYVVTGTDGGLQQRIQHQISELRRVIQSQIGATLPGINFRDNLTLPPDQYRFLIRDAPVAEGTLDQKTRERILEEEKKTPTPEGIWDPLLIHLYEAVLSKWADFYGPQEIIWELRAMKAQGRGDYDELQKNPELLKSFTVILKGLLAERVPVLDLQAIFSSFTEGQAAGRGLTTLVEDIRSLPQIRSRLAGNDLVDPYAFMQLSKQFEKDIEACVDRATPQPILAADATRLVMWSTSLQKGLATRVSDRAALLVRPEIRPFVRRITDLHLGSVPVLSYGEIMPALVGRVEGEIPLV